MALDFLNKYIGKGLIPAIFAVAFIYLCIKEKDETKRLFFVYSPAIIFAVFFFPLFADLFAYFADETTFTRVLWLIPFSVEVGYFLVTLIFTARGRGRIFATVGMLVLIAVGGRFNLKADYYTKSENLYQVPQTVIDICDYIEYPGREVMAMFPYEFVNYVRQYTALVCMPYGRDSFAIGGFTELSHYVWNEEYEAGELSRLAKEEMCHYLIISEKKKIVGSLEDYNYELINTIDGYSIYIDHTFPLEY